MSFLQNKIQYFNGKLPEAIEFGFDWMVLWVVWTGKMTGLANWASSELTTPKLGARNEVTDRETIVGNDDGVGVVLLACCSNCFNSTFCESSGLWIATENLQFSVVLSAAFCVTTVDSIDSSFSSLIVFDASMLLCRLLIIWAGVSLRKPGTSSVDFDRRNGLLVNWVCSNFAFGFWAGWLSVALKILPGCV